MPSSSSVFSSPMSQLSVVPDVLAESARRLRGLVPASAPQMGGVSLLDDADGAAIAPDSGVARFFTALDAAARAQEGRVAALGRYADVAAGALDWMAGEVGDAEASSSARFGRDGEVMA